MNPIIKPLATLALAATLTATSVLPALAYDKQTATQKADMLNAIELFRGTENGYELEKPLTRMEALIMLIRLSGKENEALYGEEYAHPFTDAPKWEDASKYLGYAYQNGLTTGVTETTFDPNSRASLQMYVTFALRALGYTDTETQKVWENWESLSSSANLVPETVDKENFLRGDAVEISLSALAATVQGKDATLEQVLSESGVFSPLSLAVAKAKLGTAEVTAQSPLMDIIGAMYAKADGVYVPALMADVIPEDRMDYFLGVTAEQLPVQEAIFCEPMMTSTAHSVCLVRVKDGVNVEEAKKMIKENVNPQKWICVSVSNVYVESIDNLILLVMDDINPDAFVNTFKAMNPDIVKADENGMFKVSDKYVEADEVVNMTSVENYMLKLVDLRDTYFPEAEKVYYATIPEKSYMVRDQVSHYLNHDAISGFLKETLWDWTAIEFADKLTIDDYYNTDRHWKQESLMPVVQELAKAMNFTVTPEAYKENTLSNFTGDYKKAVPEIPAETLTYLTSDVTDGAKVDDFQNKTAVTVYNLDKFNSKIPYDVFLSGATPLTVIENPKVTEKRELVIFRDSYGSSIVPLMLESYSKVTLVDLRYMASTLLPQYVDFTDAEVLVLMCDKVVNNSAMLK